MAFSKGQGQLSQLLLFAVLYFIQHSFLKFLIHVNLFLLCVCVYVGMCVTQHMSGNQRTFVGIDCLLPLCNS